MRIEILRQAYPGARPQWQSFDIDVDVNNTVATLLDELNHRDDLVDESGERQPRIAWECSCLQGMCGSCAMVINGRPRLACETFLRDLTEPVRIRPLTKFPVIHDLVVDRGIITKDLGQSGLYVHGEVRSDPDSYGHQYLAARCLKCGLCLEVCPNYSQGARFYGAAFANECYLAASKSDGDTSEIRENYAEHFGNGCSKSLSCMDVCPVHIPTLASIAKMNRGKKKV